MRVSQRKGIFFPDPMFGTRVYLNKKKKAINRRARGRGMTHKFIICMHGCQTKDEVKKKKKGQNRVSNWWSADLVCLRLRMDSQSALGIGGGAGLQF